MAPPGAAAFAFLLSVLPGGAGAAASTPSAARRALCGGGGGEGAGASCKAPEALDSALLQFRSSTARSAATDRAGEREVETFGRFCGVATNNEMGNQYSSADLLAASRVASPSSMWHYNWKFSTSVQLDGVLFVPIIKEPGSTNGVSLDNLPQAHTGGAGGVIKGWNEPDDPGQAGRDYRLRSDPEAFAQAWTEDMQHARSKGYTEFVSPAMAHDVCWLDHFLKACDATAGCKDLVTYLALHRYRNDCADYVADPGSMAWRSDLSYILSYYRLMTKYNQRGFNIKGLIWDELGCLEDDYSSHAAQDHQLRFMQQFYDRTLVSVKAGDQAMIDQIMRTDWIMPVGPDAHDAQSYRLGQCKAISGGPTAREDTVQAIRSLVSVAWFSISPGKNHLWIGGGEEGLSALGQAYYSACQRLRADSDINSDQPSGPNSVPTEAPTSAPEADDDVVVRFVSAATGRSLYADAGSNWGWGFGARSGSSVAGADSWSVTQKSDGTFRIVNQASDRALYAAAGKQEAESLGAGSPPSNVGRDGDWELLRQQDGRYRVVCRLSGRALYDDQNGRSRGGLGAGSPAAEVAGDRSLWILEVESGRLPTEPQSTTDTQATPAGTSSSTATTAVAETTTAMTTTTETLPPGLVDGGVVEIVNVVSERQLYASPGSDGARGFGARKGGQRAGAEALWKLVRTGAGRFRVVNEASMRTLYATAGKTLVDGVGAGESVGADGEWEVTPVSGDMYRLMNAFSKRGLYDTAAMGAVHASELVGAEGAWHVRALVRDEDVSTSTPGPAPEGSTAAVRDSDSPTDPLDGAVVTIMNAASQRSLFAAAGSDGSNGFGARSSGETSAGQQDHHWRLSAAAGGGYRIEAASSRRELFASPGSNWDQGIGAGAAGSVGGEGTWSLERQDGGGERYRLVNKLSGRSLYAQPGSTGKAGLGAGFPASNVGRDGVWALAPVA